MRNTKQVLVDLKTWSTIRTVLPRMSDSKRSILLGKVFIDSGFVEKLKPELTDTSSDKLIKKVLRGLI